MAITRLGQAGTTTGSGTATTIAQALGVAVAVGDVVIADVSWGSGSTTPSGVADDLGNTYTRPTNALVVDGSDGQSSASYYCISAFAGSPTITATWAVAVGFRALIVTAYNNPGGLTFDKAAGALSAANPSSSGNANVAQANSLFHGSAADTGAFPPPTTGAGFTAGVSVGDSSSTASLITEWTTAAAGNLAATFGNATATNNTVIAMVFSPAALGAMSVSTGTRRVGNAQGPYDQRGFLKQRLWWYDNPAAGTSPVTVFPDVGALVITGFAPTVSVSNNQIVLPGAGSVVITGFAPTVTVSNNQNVAPGAGAIVITGFAPTVSISNNQSVLPGTGAVVITGFAPTVFASDNKTVTPGVGSIDITGFAPTVTVAPPGSVNVIPGTGDVVIIGYAPSVDITTTTPPTTGSSSVGGGSYSTQHRDWWRALEKDLKARTKDDEDPSPRKKKRRPKKVELEPEPRLEIPSRVAVLEDAPTARAPRASEGDTGAIKPYRYELRLATLKPYSGARAQLLPSRRSARVALLEPDGIQNPTEDEIYLVLHT